MTKPTSMLLEANFDINQIGETLEWKFSRRDGDGNPVKGRYAGAIYFTIGEKMRIRVRAGSYEQFESFKVLDCTLITRPQIVAIAPGVLAQYAKASPFVNVTGASVTIPADEFVSSQTDADPVYYKMAQKWENHLTVGESTGRWEISFVLTVQITRANGDTSVRVFAFDPEGQVGAGINPPEMCDVNDKVACDLDPEGQVISGLPT